MNRSIKTFRGLAATLCVCSAAAASELNLAVVATPSTSHVSGDTSLAALNDDHAPNSSHVRGRGSYGNWPARGTQWVQYEWSQPIGTRRVDVYWWDDRRGVRLPKACRLLYWEGGQFHPVSNPSGLGVAANQYNTTTFDEIRTSRIRLEMDGDGNYSTGILEWRVYDSGTSPEFPPVVAAGVDRVVVVGGKTYLSGEVRTLNEEDRLATKLKWSKASGPGAVTFADPGAPVTTATFSESGDYTLNLMATNGALSSESTLEVQAIPRPPESPLQPIPTKKYTIDNRLWNDRAKSLIVNWIPHCIDKISDPDLPEGGINNFVEAAKKLAGEPHEKHRGYVFSNAWVYNTIEATCLALMVDARGDRQIIEAQQAMRLILDDWIPKILAAQEPDGYIQTSFTLGDQPRWSPSHRGGHEGYVAGYFLEAAIAHYMMTNRTDARLYDAAVKLADCWCDSLGPPPKKPWYDGHQAMEIALVRFGRLVDEVEGEGKGEKYIKLAKFLLDNRRDGQPYDQSHRPVIHQYEAVGHAVRAVYNYAGMADVAMETGDEDYQSAVMSLWSNIVHRKYYVTGGVGSGETSEGFGPNFSLPHDGYCESCSSCGEIFFQHKLHLMHHDAVYADLYEETLYNALLGSVDLEGKHFYYQNPLVSRRARYDWHQCPCCVGNIPRTLLMLPTWMYSKSVDSIYVNLFVGSTVTVGDVSGTDVTMVQATDYPWSGDVSITVNPADEREFSVKIRVPQRSVSALYAGTPQSDGITSIALNGSAIMPRVEKGYAVITRTWQVGDKITLSLPMKIQRVKGIDKIAATRDQVALQYGPLIYSVESVDQDVGGVLRSDSALHTEWRDDFLGGVTTIEGVWADGSPLIAIPYYARNNRDLDVPSGGRAVRSSVWMKER